MAKSKGSFLVRSLQIEYSLSFFVLFSVQYKAKESLMGPSHCSAAYGYGLYYVMPLYTSNICIIVCKIRPRAKMCCSFCISIVPRLVKSYFTLLNFVVYLCLKIYQLKCIYELFENIVLCKCYARYSKKIYIGSSMFLTPDQRIINKSTTIYADMIHILIEITK